MRFPPTPSQLTAAAVNGFDRLTRGGVADLRGMPRAIIDEGPQRTVYRYHRASRKASRGAPLLLVPPLAAPSVCFDLRRGCSLVEHEVALGRDVYLVDYGAIAFADRDLGLEHWFESVIPNAIQAVAKDSGSEQVDILGWCLGGIMAMLAVAEQPDLPVRALATVASPFDFTQVPLIAPLRPLVNIAGGAGPAVIYRVLGGAPAPIVKRAYQLAGADKYITKPLAILQNLDDRDFLAQLEAVDQFMDGMLAYPGRTFGQLYHRFFRTNDLASGYLDVDGGRIELSDVRQPVLSIAGNGDGIAPIAAVHHVGELLTGSESVTLETAPGGHLGVLTGRAARTTTWEIIDRFLDRAA
ncbi:MAG: alpha/beta hydrolase [Solirubrobacterales bacterium]|nr:alpha/beta hydrolase [Solirubrobacterales bacterium]